MEHRMMWAVCRAIQMAFLWLRTCHNVGCPLLNYAEDGNDSMGEVKYIFVAAERGSPMLSLPKVEAVTDVGLRGDRYAQAQNRKSADYQVTLIELENIEAFAQASGLPLAPHDPRRNLITIGVRLNELCGRRFSVGGAELEGLELCEPCGTFAKRTHPQVVRFFVHKGGLRCRIIRG